MKSVKLAREARTGRGHTASYLFLFLILPSFVVWLLGTAFINQSEDLAKNRLMAALDHKAEKVCSFIDPINYLNDLFVDFAQSIDWHDVDSAKIQQLYQKFHGEKIHFIPYVFKNGKLITPPEILDESANSVVSIWNFLHGQPTKTILEHKAETQSLFGGSYVRLKFQIDSGHPIEFVGKNGKGLFFNFQPDDSAPMDGMMIISWKVPETKLFSQFIPASLLGSLEISMETRGLEPDKNWAQTKPDGAQKDGLYIRKTMGSQYLNFKESFPELNFDFYRWLLKILVVALILVLAIILRNPFIRESIVSFSVSFKMVALAFYAVILPLSGLLFFGWKLVAEHRELLNQEAYIACQSSIHDLENEFEREKSGILNLFRSFKSLPEMATSSSLLQKKFEAIEANRLMNWIEIQDINTKVLASTQDPEASEKVGVVTKVFSKFSMKRYLSHRLPLKQSSMPSAAEVVLQEFLESPIGGWSKIFESPDELHQVRFGGLDLLWYWDVFTEPEFQPAFILCDQQFQWAVNNFLQEILKSRSSYENGALRRMAWYIEENSLISSETDSSPDELKDFIGQVRRNNSLQSTMITWKGQKWFAAGAPGKRLTGFVILCLYPTSIIDDKISLISSDLVWGIVLALLLTFLVVRLFSNTVVSPLALLMGGVQALRKRETGHRIEILQNDEFGHLSKSFNQTIETLEDVLNAKTIQHQIIPVQAPEIEGFQADLFTLAAADLGGSYCDIQALPGNQWLLIIGDVNGHGLSSSLVTAMAKSIVMQSVVNEPFSISEMFACINELLHSQFKQQKYMSCFASVLDLNLGKIEFINAGHLFPLHFSGGRPVKFHAQNYEPLGIKVGSSGFSLAEFAIFEGDCLVLFTEACAKLLDKTGQPYGLDGFNLLCQNFQHLPAREMREAIISSIPAATLQSLESDLTLIILKKIKNTDSSPIDSNSN